MQVEYRNSSYFGTFKDYQRNGYGMIVLDNSNIIMGNHHLIQPDGKKDISTETMHSSLIKLELLVP